MKLTKRNLDKEKIENSFQIQQKQAMIIEILLESSFNIPKDEILSECEEVLLGTL